METLGERTEAQRFFGEIEEAFGRLRGRPLLLSPRDVGLVRQWHEAGVPLKVVLKALEVFFERERRREKPRRLAPALGYCERDVYDLWEEWKSARLADREDDSGTGTGAAAGTEGLLHGHLEALEQHLQAATRAAKARGEKLVARALKAVVKDLAPLHQPAAAGDWPSVERVLRAAEDKVLKAAKKELGNEGLEELRGRVRQQVTALGKGIDEKAFEVLLEKAEDRAVLTRFDLPRIALFAF